MGLSSFCFKVLCAISTVIAVLVLILSALYMHKVLAPLGITDTLKCSSSNSPNNSTTQKSEEKLESDPIWCKYFKMIFSAAVMGIIISIIQFTCAIFLLLGYCGRVNGYAGSHCFCAIICFICLILAWLVYSEFSEGFKEAGLKPIMFSFMAFLLVDGIYCVGSSIVMLVMSC